MLKVLLADLAHTYSAANQSIPIPLGIGYIKTYCMAVHGNKVAIELFKDPEELMRAAMINEVDVIGFANYGWNENLNLAVGKYLRQALPKVVMVAGGPNIDPDRQCQLAFLERHNYLDYLIIDAGEEPFSNLLEYLDSLSATENVRPSNLVWRTGNSIQFTENSPATKKKIENIPSPYLAGYLDRFIELGMVPMFESNRGCPFKCTFCAWGSASKDLVRQFDIETILAEIEYVSQRSPARNWIFCDANFGMLQRDVTIAQAIRKAKDSRGLPEQCHIWLSKNTTDRNLAIGRILAEMTVPVMAVQSFNPETLSAIKRGNIALTTYEAYQQSFHKIGSSTYSDLIVPLPNETLATHLDALAKLFFLRVDIVANHNLRLLAGSELNLNSSREKYQFRARYRLIHGDAGRYATPSSGYIDAFEYEESLRETTTFSEPELFYLRKIHFLVDFCWNSKTYAPLLKLLLSHGVNPVEVFKRILASLNPKIVENEAEHWKRIRMFFDSFDADSRGEWFDSKEAIEEFFSNSDNFDRLIDQQFDKLNILYSILALRDYKPAFDYVFAEIATTFDCIPTTTLQSCATICFNLFPSLQSNVPPLVDTIEGCLVRCFSHSAQDAVCKMAAVKVRVAESKDRDDVRRLLLDPAGACISKIMNTQGLSVEDLGYVLEIAGG